MRKILIFTTLIALTIGFSFGRLSNSNAVVEEPEVYEAPVESLDSQTEESIAASPWPSSVITYNISNVIARNLDKQEFDSKFTEFLKKEDIVPRTGFGDGPVTSFPEGLMAVKDDGFLTIDLVSGVMLFNLHVQSGSEPIISCAVGNGEYDFELK